MSRAAATTPKQRTVFLTGATGLVGGYLLRRLAARDDLDIHVLIRPKDGEQTAPQRLRTLWEYFGGSPPQPLQVHAGDIARERLGLSPECYDRLRHSVTDIVHAAADVSFSGSARMQQEINVRGTLNVARLGTPETRLFYVSTAFVAGTCATPFAEDALDMDQSFRNAYEASKFQAECALREAFAASPQRLTVFRPTVVTGEQQSGRTFQLQHLYAFLSALSIFSEHHPAEAFALPHNADSRQNCLPVDRLAEMMEEVILEPTQWGRTFHLTDPKPPSNREMQLMLENVLGIRIVNREPDRQSRRLNRTAARRARSYMPYLMSQPVLRCDQASTLRSWREQRILDEAYLTRMIRFEKTLRQQP